jgi:hypothetical protein
MANHIVRRAPASKPTRQQERKPTAEMGPQQLHGLIREHDAPAADRRDGAGISPSTPGPRLAHTLRRGPQRGAVLSAVPAPVPPPIDRPEVSTIAMPRLERPARLAIPRLYKNSDEESAATVVARSTPRVIVQPALEPARPIARSGDNPASPGAASVAARGAAINAEPGATRARPEVVLDAAPQAHTKAVSDAVPGAVTHAADPLAISAPGSNAAPDSRPLTAGPADARLLAPPASDAAPASEPLTARRAGARPRAALRTLLSAEAARFTARSAGSAKQALLRGTWRARLAVPVALLVALGTVSLLLRAIL